MDDLAIEDKKKELAEKAEEKIEQADGIDDLIARMDKVTIDKQ